ncbi:hypothetical protein GCM10028857_02520 [Salinarchaeum chitinilyticum]
MMLPTHVLAGLAIALPVATIAPDLAPAAFAGGAAGSVLPDLDIYAGHRRTLHYPVYYPIAAVLAGLGALAVPAPATVGVAFLLLAASLHCRMDELGGSLELRPWAENSDRGVYDHHSGEWRPPRRLIRYDGSPGDLAATGLLAIPLLLLTETPVRWLVVAALVVGISYAVLRKWLADVVEWAVEFVPNVLTAYLPGRYRGS